MSETTKLINACCRAETQVELSALTIVVPLGSLSYLLYKCPMCGEEAEYYITTSSADLLAYRGVDKVELPTDEELRITSSGSSYIEYLENKMRDLAVTELPDPEA